MDTLNDYLDKGLGITQAEAALAKGLNPQSIYQVSGSQKTAWAARWLRDHPGFIVTYGEEQARKWLEDLQFWLPDRPVHLFMPNEWMDLDIVSHTSPNAESRCQVFDILTQYLEASENNGQLDRPLIIMPIQALIQKLVSPRRRQESRLPLKTGQTCSPDSLIRELVRMGYKREQIVEEPGCFALRGGICDIAPLASLPVRLEFFDDEIDSIRTFDLETQKSLINLTAVTVSPVAEIVLNHDEIETIRWTARVQAQKVRGRLESLGNKDICQRLDNRVKRLEDHLDGGIIDESVYPYLMLLNEPYVTLLDYLPLQSRVVFDEPHKMKDQVVFMQKQRLQDYTADLERGEAFVDGEAMYSRFEDVVDAAKGFALNGLSSLEQSVLTLTPRFHLPVPVKILDPYLKTAQFLEDLDRWLKQGFSVLLCAGSEDYAERLLKGLEERDVLAGMLSLERTMDPKRVFVAPFSLENGFALPESKLVVFSELEIYRRDRKERRIAAKRAQVLAERQEKGFESDKNMPLGNLQPGDYLVHSHHGVGMFVGLEKIEFDGVAREYFNLQYAGADRLYVPVYQVELLQRYLGAEAEARPRLNKMGGSDWQKAKSRAKSAIRELAIDLLALYAEREKIKGFAFPADDAWQQEFEDQFEYEETPDQRRCVLEIKQDMMKGQPMDRLLCGDVGYGKTEVALRAVFKAVSSGKQVAVLVPTTILAQQHFTTFKERFKNYPVTVDMLCRLRSVKEQNAAIRGLRDGTVDVVVGTHRLISESVKYQDLGLLVVDEEQRFGVEQKEKIKSLKKNVDVLTLSATPIPRTLHMSLVGLRDMSIISTPPEHRYPIQTYIAEYSPELIRGAIQREMQRGGQVFYVYNRIEGLEKITAYLGRLVPEARLCMVHGRMPEAQLEKEMLSFINKEKDVLVCTTIIETGLDIANVNTMIVDEADCFGLNQLYQLRGRIGRSHRKAFAYFLYAPQKVLTEEAETRLRTIREFTELGAGYKIAMRDLEIRGAGNLIGGEQHGHMAAVGFNMYTQMLQQEVEKLRRVSVDGDTTARQDEEEVMPAIDINIPALLPDDFVPDRQVKANLYQRILGIVNEDEADVMWDELVDRFGTPPEAVENLFFVVRIKLLMKQLKIDQIEQNRDIFTIRFYADPGLSGEKFLRITAQSPYSITIAAANSSSLELKVNTKEKNNLRERTNTLSQKTNILLEMQKLLCSLTE
ncbi:MAG: transcription-repair coupling factor [Peptococcaceae bacterium]|nr:transcription-repair coupling factor [Peptococcaceae bacterium]